MGDLPRGRTLLGIKTPDNSTNPPPWVGTRFGDSSKFQRLDIPGGFHAGWDCWEVEGAPVTAPRSGVVLDARRLGQVTANYNVVVQTELTVPSRLHPGQNVKVYMMALHTHPANGIQAGKWVERGEKLGSVGFFGMNIIGNPHAHIEFFWSKAAALAYDHARAVDPYFIRKHYLDEPSPLVLVPAQFRWWEQRENRPGTNDRIKPFERELISSIAAKVTSLGSDDGEAQEGNPEDVLAAYRFAEGEDPQEHVAYGCGSGEPDEKAIAKSLRANGLIPVYRDGGDFDIERMIGEQEGMTLEEATYQEDE
jgi:murein DD-endopeptidase MepM/ murein hydrolase activator NlpD